MNYIHMVRGLAVAVLVAVLLPLIGSPASAVGGRQVDVARQADWQPNGCTSPFGNEPSGASFLGACNEHDRCYYQHSDPLGKSGCDLRFLWNMNASCTRAANGNAGLAAYCYAWAAAYYAAVGLLGDVFYVSRWDPRIWPHQRPNPPAVAG
jgi:hypothetical protein